MPEDDPLDDESALIREARRGDHEAFAALVRRYQEVSYRTAYLLLADAQEAEDVVQEGFLKAYDALGRFREGAAFRPWILTIVANEARNRRLAAARRMRLIALAASSGQGDGHDPSPEAAAVAKEQREHLLDALRDLAVDDRLVIIYRYFSQLTEAEMADALGCARGTVKSRLSRALGRLRAILAAARLKETEGMRT